MVRTNVKPATVKVILMGVALLLLLNALARFNILNLTQVSSTVITLITSLALLTEVSVWDMLKGRRKNVLSIVIAVTAGLALLGAGLSLFGLSIAVLNPIQGLVDTGLLIFALVEIFRK